MQRVLKAIRLSVIDILTLGAECVGKRAGIHFRFQDAQAVRLSQRSKDVFCRK